jgi:hypothetical protein
MNYGMLCERQKMGDVIHNISADITNWRAIYYDWENNPISKTVLSWGFFPVFQNPQSATLTNGWIRIRPRALLFLSVTLKTLIKNKFFSKFFAYYVLKVHLHYFS